MLLCGGQKWKFFLEGKIWRDAALRSKARTPVSRDAPCGSRPGSWLGRLGSYSGNDASIALWHKPSSIWTSLLVIPNSRWTEGPQGSTEGTLLLGYPSTGDESEKGLRRRRQGLHVGFPAQGLCPADPTAAAPRWAGSVSRGPVSCRFPLPAPWGLVHILCRFWAGAHPMLAPDPKPCP